MLVSNLKNTSIDTFKVQDLLDNLKGTKTEWQTFEVED